MKKHLFILTVLVFIFTEKAMAQLPNCTTNPSTIIYIQTGTSIYNYDVTLPMSATNPSLNTITMPSGSGGLAVSNNLNAATPSPTFYTSVGNNWWYYNGATWTNTGHSCGNAAAVNSGGGGQYLYNLVGASGQVYQYDGTSNSTLLLTVPGFSGGGPYDLVGHCDGGFYILRTNTGAFLRKYSPTGILQGSWTTTGSSNNAGGGFAIANNRVYYQNSGFHSAPFTPPATNLAFSPMPTLSPSPSDMAVCRVCDSLNMIPPPKANFGMSSDTICAGDCIAFTDLSTDTPTVWNWNFPSGNPPNSNLQNPTNVCFDTAGTYIIRLIASNAGGSDTATRTLQVYPKPVATITGNTDICSGESTTLSAALVPGGTYLWSTNDTSQNITVSPNTTTTYTLIVSNGNCEDTTQITVNVTAQPVASITGASQMCFNETTTLTAGPIGVSYLWSTSDVSQSISVSPSATTIYSVVTTNGQCVDSATFTLLVNELPIVSATSTLTDCDVNTGSATAVAGLGTSPYSFDWNGFPGATITGLPVGTYNVVVTDSKGCTATTSVDVGMHPLPTATITPYPVANVRIGESVQLNVTGGQDYEWNPGFYLSCTNCPNPVVSRPLEELLVYCVKVTDVHGCEDTACTTVIVDTSCSSIFIPNAFSPNNDGNNDKISVKNTCDIDRLIFRIFNRFGQLVFETNSVGVTWDGTLNGEPQPISTFHYYLEADLINGRQIRQRGDILLIR